MRKVILLSNPDSGSGEAEAVATCLRGHDLEVCEFGLDEIDKAFATNPDRAVVAGGDGSLACVAAPASRAGIPIAVIPTGTANDFARAFEIPVEIEAACELAAGLGRTRRIELGWMGDRPFFNMASVGLPPDAAEHAAELKGPLGLLAYPVGAVRAGISSDPIDCVVRCDDREIHAGEAWQVSVACVGTFGGGSSLDTDPSDGRLDVVVIEAGSRAKLAVHAVGMRRGTVEEQDGVVTARCGTTRVEFDGERPFNVDGELIESGSVDFRADAAAVEVVVG